ncbi:unnamed protein product [Durusdinium trenchii]|uniref:Nuclear pore complex protein Nup88 n=1 Tax=Durusdinium trenchii TaxID=1381693 RepID=A0ABP0H4L5_9DINO
MAAKWSALAHLPLWAQASSGSLAVAELPGGLTVFLLGKRAAYQSGETSEVVHICVQDGSGFIERRLLIDVKIEPSETAEPEPFQQLHISSGYRALALWSPARCAVVSLDGALEQRQERLEAMVFTPAGKSLVKVAWHPTSDAHLGILFSDGSWSLLNLAMSIDEPELHFVGDEVFVDFTFVSLGSKAVRSLGSEDAWLSLSVFFLAASGRVSFRGPVLPSTAVLSFKEYEALQAALVQDSSPLTVALAASLSASAAPDGEHEVVLVTHRHHLHGSGEPMSLSLQLPEHIIEEPSTTSTPCGGTSFSTLQVCSSSPLILLARATSSGLVELLALDTPVRPSAASSAPRVAARVLEEIDLSCSRSPSRTGTSDFIRLSKHSLEDAHLFVHTRSLLAAIDVSSSCSSSCSSSTVTTLAETRSDEMDFVSWTVLESGLGLLLRMERGTSSRRPVMKLLEVTPRDSAPDRRNASMHFSKQSAAPAQTRGPLDLLEQPIASFGATPPQTAEKPLELATRVAGLRGGLASIACRQELLKHLVSKSFPARAEEIKQELDVDTSELLRRSGAGKQRAKQLLERQKELVERQEALVKALRAAAESSSLESFKDTVVPKLYAQLYELRRAGQLLQSASHAGHPGEK